MPASAKTEVEGKGRKAFVKGGGKIPIRSNDGIAFDIDTFRLRLLGGTMEG